MALATAIKTGLTGNAKFPNPNPALVAFAALITALLEESDLTQRLKLRNE